MEINVGLKICVKSVIFALVRNTPSSSFGLEPMEECGVTLSILPQKFTLNECGLWLSIASIG
jgi:hypothetical protein